MTAKAQLIELTRGYIPIIPERYPEVLLSTQEEDKGEKPLSAIIVDGGNFLPTLSGVMSITYTDFDRLPPIENIPISTVVAQPTAVEYCIFFPSKWCILLCNNGAFYFDFTDGDQTEWELIFDSDLISGDWTWVQIDKTLYFHKGNSTLIYTIVDDVISFFTASFVTELKGIFQAGTRLGGWDSDNTVYWSSADDHSDMTPSITTLAGYATFEGVRGDIVTIKGHGNGFVIYATNSIVGSRFLADSDLLWKAESLLSTGITRNEQVTEGRSINEHFVETSAGLFVIETKTSSYEYRTATLFHPEVLEYVRQNARVFPKVVNSRYLILGCIDETVIPDYENFDALLKSPVFDLHLERWGLLDITIANFYTIAEIPESFALDPRLMGTVQRSPRPFFNCLFFGRSPYGDVDWAIVTRGIGFQEFCGDVPLLVPPAKLEEMPEFSVVYSGIGLNRMGYTRMHGLRIYRTYVDLEYQTLEVIITAFDTEGNEFNVVTTVNQDSPRCLELFFDVVAKYLTINIKSVNSTIIRGLELIAEPAGRR